jgi:hypothetical protein
MQIRTQDCVWSRGRGTLVDLGGIVHFVTWDLWPTESSEVRAYHEAFRDEMDLQNRDAVGLVRLREIRTALGAPADGLLGIFPIVWVRAIDSFFFETSCGSGSIAAAVVAGSGPVVQPSNGVIDVRVEGPFVRLESEMEVLMCTSNG